MKAYDRGAIKALIGAIEGGNIVSIRKILCDGANIDFLKRNALIEIAMHGVLSSAIEFQRAKLPNCEWRLHSDGYAYIVGPDGLIKASAHNASPATALVVATLRAMLATNE